MDIKDFIKPQIVKVELQVYEGEIVRDAEGNITNKLQQTLEYKKEDQNGNNDER